MRRFFFEQENASVAVQLRDPERTRIFHFFQENERTNMQITKLLLAELGKGEELIQYVEDRLGHDRRYAIDSSKMQRELGWEPKHTFETGIRETIAWYKKNQKWLAQVSGKADQEEIAAAAAAAQAQVFQPTLGTPPLAI